MANCGMHEVKGRFMNWVVLFNGTVSYSYYDNDSSSLAVIVSISRLGDGVGYYNNHFLSGRKNVIPS